MRDWLSSLASDRLPEVALALAIGYALVSLADSIVYIPINALAQHFGRNPLEEDFEVAALDFTPYDLNFSLGRTAIAYGPVLSAALSLGVVALVAWFIVRRRDRVLGECPFCASRIPYESTHCAYCGSGVTLGEPEVA